MRRLAVACIRLYQRWISPLLGQNCRFYPSCSQYAIEALEIHGVIRGLCYACWRIARCNPFSPGGFDPVPGTASSDPGSSDTTST